MATDMFIKLTDIKGESIDRTHKDEIDVIAWSWGVSQSGTMHASTGGGAGKVNVQDLCFTKYVDKTSPALLLKCCNGTHIPEATLTIRKAGETPIEYLRILLKEIIVSSVSTGGSGGEDRLTENVSLNFAKLKVIYKTQLPTGGAGPEVPMMWNIPQNTSAF